MNELLSRLTPLEVLGLITLSNLLIVAGVVVLGNFLIKWFGDKRICDSPETTTKEVLLLIVNIIMNIAVTFGGYYLWRNNIIIFTTDTLQNFLLDLAVLLVAMDALMYFLHRIAHLKIIYPFMHSTHHIYDNPKPINLFALHPLENMCFGILWLILISLYSACWSAISTYLVLNVLSGLIGHLGVEPFPESWKKNPVMKYIGSSSFHANHHQDPNHNFGFYTTIWDKLFKTLK